MFACMHALDNSMHNLGKRSYNFPEIERDVPYFANDMPSSMPATGWWEISCESIMLLGTKNTSCSHTYYSASIGKFYFLAQTPSPT